jgi:AraC-like DNA-binding protein
MNIPDKYYKTTTVFKRIGNNEAKGLISCGFIHKKSSDDSNIHVISDCYTGILLINGSGTFIGPDGNVTDLVQGCFVQRIPGVLHSTIVSNDGKWLEFFISIDQDIYREMCNLNIFNKNDYVLFPGINIGILDTCENFLTSLQKTTYFHLPYLLTRSIDFIYSINSYHTKQLENKYEIIDEAIELLNQNAFKRINTKELINKLGLGYENFRKIFKASTGISPTQYIINYRINSAKSLLIEDKLSINEIADYLGYNDVFYFSNQFKKYTGYTPNAFKKRS